ncbi:MAG: hypothetical protein JWN04_459 [Myxococcaceae bacterium]|nr:hypothetical protein [Myxococcaceae bacterium]
MNRLDLSVLAVCVPLFACGGGDHHKSDTSAEDAGTNDSSTRDGAVHGGLDAASDARDASHFGLDGSGPIARGDAGQVLCGNAPCACSDGLDNDVDGLVDLADPECVSSWDNDEASFATGIPGDNRDDACQDCFFDGNSGSGDDGCRLPSSCLTTGTPSSGQGSCNSCVASDRCKNFCEAYTPNGCDCFGCCTVQVGSNITKSVLLSSGCNIDGDVFTGCTTCMPSVSCVNACGRCELCPGKTLDQLPADCNTTVGVDAGSPTPTCDQGETPCGAGLASCGSGEACSFGCCILVPVI